MAKQSPKEPPTSRDTSEPAVANNPCSATEPTSGYDPSVYPPFAVTVDLVILSIRDAVLQVLLVRRGLGPSKGCLALPGGFVRIDEDLEEAAWRELSEETGLAKEVVHLEQLKAYGAPDRDERMRVVTVAWLGLAPGDFEARGGGDAASAGLFPVRQVLGQNALAFDHDNILNDGVTRARKLIEETTLATRFCGDRFTLGELQRVYEAVWGRKLDTRNFRRKIQEYRGMVREVRGEKTWSELGGPHAQVYTRGLLDRLEPPFRRPERRGQHSLAPLTEPDEHRDWTDIRMALREQQTAGIGAQPDKPERGKG